METAFLKADEGTDEGTFKDYDPEFLLSTNWIRGDTPTLYFAYFSNFNFV